MVIITFLFILFGLITRNYHLAKTLFYDWDEGMYAQIAAEILKNKSLFTTFNGQIWLDKPPLAHTIIALIFSVFGRSEFWARMAMVLISFILLILTYLLAKKIIQTFTNKINNNELMMGSLIPVLLLASTPIFIERSALLNTDTLIAVSWMGYFLCWDNYWGKLFFLTLGVWSKSVLGFYPMLFDMFYWIEKLIINKINLRKYINIKNIVSCLVLLVVPSLWYIFGLIKFRNYFIVNHFASQVFKRLSVPIELHFGNKFYYFQYLWDKLNLINIIFMIGYLLLVIWIIKSLKTNNLRKTLLNQSKSILILLSPFPFLAILTLMKTKIYWYVIIFFPLVTLILSYIFLRLKNRILKYCFFIFIFCYFLINFIPQTFLITEKYIAPDRIKLALCLAKQPYNKVTFLVDEDERKIKNVLEAAHYDTTSSFYYGGSPSFVYYTQKKVDYYYNVNDFIKNYQNYHIIVLSKSDINKNDSIQKLVVGQKLKCSFGDWISIVK